MYSLTEELARYGRTGQTWSGVRELVRHGRTGPVVKTWSGFTLLLHPVTAADGGKTGRSGSSSPSALANMAPPIRLHPLPFLPFKYQEKVIFCCHTSRHCHSSSVFIHFSFVPCKLGSQGRPGVSTPAGQRTGALKYFTVLCSAMDCIAERFIAVK